MLRKLRDIDSRTQIDDILRNIDQHTKADDLLKDLVKINTVLAKQQIITNKLLQGKTNISSIDSSINLDTMDGTGALTENIDSLPQYMFDFDRNKFYKKTGTILLSNVSGSFVTGSTNTTIDTTAYSKYISLIETTFGISIPPYDILRYHRLKSCGYNLITGSLLGPATCDVYKNNKKVVSLQLQEANEAHPIVFDKSDENWYILNPTTDTIKTIITNNSGNTIVVHTEAEVWFYREITKRDAIEFIKRTKDLYKL